MWHFETVIKFYCYTKSTRPSSGTSLTRYQLVIFRFSSHSSIPDVLNAVWPFDLNVLYPFTIFKCLYWFVSGQAQSSPASLTYRLVTAKPNRETTYKLPHSLLRRSTIIQEDFIHVTLEKNHYCPSEKWLMFQLKIHFYTEGNCSTT